MHIGLDLQLAQPQNLPPTQSNLHNVLSVMCRTRRDPQNGPVCATPLLTALAPCLQQSGNGFGPFTADMMECAGEFLNGLLSELRFLPNSLVFTQEVGVCVVCGVQQQTVQSYCDH